MFKNYLLLLFILVLTCACGTVQPQMTNSAGTIYGGTVVNPYLRQIVSWQGRLAREDDSAIDYEELSHWKSRVATGGWNRETVRAIVAESKALTSYEMEIEDRWDTPNEFVEKLFRGDCEDIAVFIMSNMRLLDYPYTVRVMAVKTYLGDHALVKIQMPDLSWQVFETVQTAGGEDAQLVYTPIVEFDENEIITYAAL